MYVTTNAPVTTHCLLLASLHRFATTTAVYQEWVLAFNSFKPCGMILSVWIILRLLPLEFIDHAHALASVIGKVLSIGKAPLHTP